MGQWDQSGRGIPSDRTIGISRLKVECGGQIRAGIRNSDSELLIPRGLGIAKMAA